MPVITMLRSVEDNDCKLVKEETNVDNINLNLGLYSSYLITFEK